MRDWPLTITLGVPAVVVLTAIFGYYCTYLIW
jgi:hypothetical protein